MKHHIAPIISKKLSESSYQIFTLNNKFKNYCSNITYETSYSTYNFKKSYQKADIRYLLSKPKLNCIIKE